MIYSAALCRLYNNTDKSGLILEVHKVLENDYKPCVHYFWKHQQVGLATRSGAILSEHVDLRINGPQNVLHVILSYIKALFSGYI